MLELGFAAQVFNCAEFAICDVNAHKNACKKRKKVIKSAKKVSEKRTKFRG